MEEAEVPLEHLHEQVHHSAEHSRERWISWVALSTAVLAVLAAIAGLLSGHHVNEAMMNQIEASDQWSYYQAKSIKAAVLDLELAFRRRRLCLPYSCRDRGVGTVACSRRPVSDAQRFAQRSGYSAIGAIATTWASFTATSHVRRAKGKRAGHG